MIRLEGAAVFVQVEWTSGVYVHFLLDFAPVVLRDTHYSADTMDHSGIFYAKYMLSLFCVLLMLLSKRPSLEFIPSNHPEWTQRNVQRSF